MLEQSLAFKIAVFVILIFVVFTCLNSKAEEGQVMRKSKRMAELLSIAIYRELGEAMIDGEGKMQKVQIIIENYGSVEEIERIRIFDPKDISILADADEANIGNALDARHSALLEDPGGDVSGVELLLEGGETVCG